MKKLLRNKAPEYKLVDGSFIMNARNFNLANGIPVYILNSENHDLIKLDFIFEAGHWFSPNPLVADFANQMMIEGSLNYTSSEIAEKFDFYGTFINFECGKHFANLQLYTLSSFYFKSIELFKDIVKNPLYPEKEFQVMLQNEFQQFILSREKTEVLASDAFYPRLFGSEHPYGRVRKAEDFQNLNVEQLREYHKRYYVPGNCKIIVTGKISEEIIAGLSNNFGGNDWNFGSKSEETSKINGLAVPGRVLIKKDGAVQTSIKLGTLSVEKSHDDFYGLSILNTILGGYFGSRLMTSLREEKSLTYGIYSNLVALRHVGIFIISANVNEKYASTAIGHIYDEIEVLKNKPVPEDELQMVKNYLAGEMLRSFDGLLLQSEIFAGLLNFGLGFDYYDKYFTALKSIEAEKLMYLADKYLVRDNFVEILAGQV